MDWEELIAEFRELGGVAENVRLGTGRLGRGVFVIDPAKPANLNASDNLMVRCEDVELRGGQMAVKAEAAVGGRERDFFYRYQEQFGWGAGLFEEIRRSQQQWNELPAEIVNAITTLGVLDDATARFAAPTLDICLYHYVRSRYFNYHGGTYLVPLVELVNHDSRSGAYVIGEGIGVAGTYGGEMLVRYNIEDNWSRALFSSFADPAVFAYSVVINVEVDDRRIAVGRDFRRTDLRGGINFPRVSIEGNAIDLPFVTLGCTAAPDLPRAIFRKVVEPSLIASRADDLFDSIAHFNRTKTIELVRTFEKYDGPLIGMLEETAINQLEALSYCAGARNL